jgi:TetR/AcrR family tetracycline transcriptional repressor
MKKRTLTPEKICLVALQLIEAEGLEKLSMRKLATQLNVEAASLYNHIPNKEGLFDLLQEHLYAAIPHTIADDDWKEHLLQLANNTRQSLLKTPNVALLFATRPTLNKASLQQVEVTLNVLMEANFKPSEILTIYRNLHVFILGHVLAEVGRVPGAEKDAYEPSLAQIALTDYPLLKKVSAYKTNLDFEKGFRLGLTNLLDGLELSLKK